MTEYLRHVSYSDTVSSPSHWKVSVRLHRRLLSIAALALASAAPTVASAAVVDRTPGIISMSDASGPAAGGNTVRIGTRSLRPGTVTFGGARASAPTELVIGDDFENSIAYYYFEVRVPAGVAGSTVEVEVDGIGGVSGTSNDYTYEAPKEPLAWQCGSTFTLSGSGVPDSLAIGGRPTAYTANASAGIDITAPSPAYAAGPDYVVHAYFGSTGRTLGAYRDGCFSPSASTSDRSEGLRQISGANFGPAAGGGAFAVAFDGPRVSSSAKLYFGETPVDDTVISPNGVACIPEDPCPPRADGWIASGTIPAHAPGWVDVSLRDGSTILWGKTASSNDYRYEAPSAIHSITPSRGPLAGGGTATILVDGTWARSPQVFFGDRQATVTDWTRAAGLTDGTFDLERITVTVPAGAAAGSVDVVVRGTALGTGNPVEARGKTPPTDDFTYEAPPVPVNTPTVASLSGGPVFAGFGGFITIRGTNLGGLRSVKVGSRGAVVLGSTATQVFAYAPAQSKGSYAVSVTTRVGTATAPTKLVYRSLF